MTPVEFGRASLTFPCGRGMNCMHACSLLHGTAVERSESVTIVLFVAPSRVACPNGVDVFGSFSDPRES